MNVSILDLCVSFCVSSFDPNMCAWRNDFPRTYAVLSTETSYK